MKTGHIPTRISYYQMLRRCDDSTAVNYKDYGGRGIKVCPEWYHYPTFLTDMGERPLGTTLDRENNDKGYYKDNCRWAIKTEQQQNQRAPLRQDGTRGLVGVWYELGKKRWRVKTSKGLLSFSNLLDAAACKLSHKG